MFEEKWNAPRITDTAQRLLKRISSRASDRELHVVDDSSLLMMALWCLLHGDRKVGRVALEDMGVNRFDLARDVDRLLDVKQGPVLVDFDAALEPLLQQAEREAGELGHNYVGSEHLLLAIVRLADPALLEVLQKFAVTHGRVREAVLSLLQA